jgi:hypothetical protein
MKLTVVPICDGIRWQCIPSTQEYRTIHDCGNTPAEAVGNWLIANSGKIGISITIEKG